MMLDMEKKSTKAAILLTALGKDFASQLYGHLDEEQMEQLTIAISTMPRISQEARSDILEEFKQICIAQRYMIQGGENYARDILEKVLGPEKALALLNKLSDDITQVPFSFLANTDPTQITSILKNETLQVIALVLAYIPNKATAAAVLHNMPSDSQAKIIAAIAQMGPVTKEYVREVELIIGQSLSGANKSEQNKVGGIEDAVEILNLTDRSTERFILDTLETYDANLAEDIRNKMFVFDDIIKMDSRSLQNVIQNFLRDQNLFVTALKGASDEVKAAIFSNMSGRVAESLKETLQYMPPVRVRDIDEAQQKLVNIVRRMEDNGEIFIRRSGGEDEYR